MANASDHATAMIPLVFNNTQPTAITHNHQELLTCLMCSKIIVDGQPKTGDIFTCDHNRLMHGICVIDWVYNHKMTCPKCKAPTYESSGPELATIQRNIIKLNNELLTTGSNKNHDPREIKQLLEFGACARIRNQKDNTPLHYVTRDSNIETAKIFLENGADADASNIHWETPLHYAATNGDSHIVALLLSNGATINAKTKFDFFTPLHFAASNGKIETVKILLEAGADAQAKDNEDHTALFFVIHGEHTPEVKEHLMQLFSAF